jgi:hypothetical protein
VTIPAPLRRWLHLAGVDRAVAVTVIGRFVALLSGPITLFFQLHFLTGGERGYYVTFGGLIGMVTLLELGLAQTLAIFASHEMADLRWESNDDLSGPSAARTRLRSILRLGLKWYALIAVVLVVVMLPFGFWYFTRFGQGSVDWQWPWTLSVIIAAGNLLVSPAIAILENVGMVTDVAMLRLRQNVVSNLASWAVLALGGGLLAAPVLTGAALVVTLHGLYRWRRRVRSIGVRRGGDDGPPLAYWREIWPLQWRMGLSWLGGFSIVYLTFPIVFPIWGDVVTGQFGMSAQLGLAIQNFALPWLSTKQPVMVGHAARRDWIALDRLFFHRMWACLTVTALGAAAACVVLWGMRVWEIKYAEGFVPLVPFAILMFSSWFASLISAMALYFWAHKLDPLYKASLTQGLLLPLLALVIAEPFGVTGVALARLVTTIAFAAFAVVTFRILRRSHARVDECS